MEDFRGSRSLGCGLLKRLEFRVQWVLGFGGFGKGMRGLRGV